MEKDLIELIDKRLKSIDKRIKLIDKRIERTEKRISFCKLAVERIKLLDWLFMTAHIKLLKKEIALFKEANALRDKKIDLLIIEENVLLRKRATWNDSSLVGNLPVTCREGG